MGDHARVLWGWWDGYEDDGNIKLRISDNGPGMVPEVREKLFEPFFSTRMDGLGMGLPISRRIVELHGGQLDCVSSSNEGSVFEFTLPKKDQIREFEHVRESATHLHS